jgi:hypothetical protein
MMMIVTFMLSIPVILLIGYLIGVHLEGRKRDWVEEELREQLCLYSQILQDSGISLSASQDQGKGKKRGHLRVIKK